MTDGVKGDYDSDTILMTNDKFLISLARRHYHEFQVPTNLTTSSKIQRYYTVGQKADLDIKTSVNKIGEIINCSQQLNSLLWDRVNRGATIESCKELYNDICKLAVLSNVEIDRAKKEFTINTMTEIKKLQEKYKITDGEKIVKPKFFKMICIENGYKPGKNIEYKDYMTTMDYLQKVISKFNFRMSRENKKDLLPFSSIFEEPPVNARQGFYYKKRTELLKKVEETKTEIKKIYLDYDNKTSEAKQIAKKKAGELKQECVNYIMETCDNPSVIYLCLRAVEEKAYKNMSSLLFEVLFGTPNSVFYDMIKENNKNRLFTLEMDPNGDVEFYKLRFKRVGIVNN